MKPTWMQMCGFMGFRIFRLRSMENGFSMTIYLVMKKMIDEASPELIKEMKQFLIHLNARERDLVYSVCLYTNEEQAALIIAHKQLKKRDKE